MRRVALLLAIALLGCGDHVGQTLSGRATSPSPAPTTASSPTPVPWISAAPSYPPAPTTAEPAPVGVARCDPRTLHLDGGAHQLTMSHMYGVAYLVHDGPQCLVSGDVALRFIDDRGSVRITATSTSPWRGNPGWALAGRAQIVWDGVWCDPQHAIVSIEATYESVTYRAAIEPWTREWSCDLAPAGASLTATASVKAIAPVPTSAPPPPPSFAPTLVAPAHVRAGETLDFIVVLANATAHEVRFEPCPNYAILLNRQLAADDPRLAKPGVVAYDVVTDARHALNCAALHPLAAGESVRLAMRLDVPASASGALLLRWWLSEINATIATAPIVVDAP